MGTTALTIGLITLRALKWQIDFLRLPALALVDRVTTDLIGMTRRIRSEYQQPDDLLQAILADEGLLKLSIRREWNAFLAGADYAKFAPMLTVRDRAHVNVITTLVEVLAPSASGLHLANAEAFRVEAIRTLDRVQAELNAMRVSARLEPV